MTTPRDLLQAARERISDPACWTQGAEAADAVGIELAFPYDGATCWCASGALQAASHQAMGVNFASSSFVTALLQLALATIPQDPASQEHEQSSFTPLGMVAAFNDTKTHADVLALFDRAIKASTP